MNKVSFASFFFLIGLFCGNPQHTDAQSLSSFNVSHQYNPSGPIQFKYRLTKTSTSYKVFFEVILPSYDSLGNYQLTSFFRSSYADSSQYAETEYEWSDIADTSRYPLLRGELTFQPLENENLLVFQIKRPSTQKSFFFDVPVIEETRFDPDLIMPVKTPGSLPLLQSFFSPRDSLALLSESTSPLYAFFYDLDFAEAVPPMVVDTISVAETMEIDSSFMVEAGRLGASRTGLYLFQTDSSSGSALALRLVPFYYPRFVSIDEVLAPLKYISSKEEYGRLLSSKTRKKALDNFLLDISGGQERAKRIMQNYFARVAEANQLFTGFKEGWKTDPGMIYIVFGPPNVVERNDSGEVWTYLNMEDKSDLKFEFVRVKNIFTPGYLSLVRKNDYDRYWFRFVDLWRKGRI